MTPATRRLTGGEDVGGVGAAAQRWATWWAMLPPALSPARKQLERSMAAGTPGRALLAPR